MIDGQAEGAGSKGQGGKLGGRVVGRQEAESGAEWGNLRLGRYSLWGGPRLSARSSPVPLLQMAFIVDKCHILHMSGRAQ